MKVDPVRHSDGNVDFGARCGPGKQYPGGPQCMVNDKVLDCLTICSESGGITTEIIIKVLQHFD